MDVREKLVEIVERASVRTLPKNTCHTNIVMLVNALIEEGVTVQEWISVNDRFPEEEGLYLVAVVNDHERRYSKTAWYHGHGNWFLHQKVTHWQYLPQPPKGE